MRPTKRRLCRCCKQAFDADHRNTRHQQYCNAPACRKASKAASQRAWTNKPENRDYFSGPEAVDRVSSWQKDHPEYREQQKVKRATALQDHCHAQPIDIKQKNEANKNPPKMAEPALQDVIGPQSLVFIGFLAHFFNLTLQDDIASTTRILQQLGADITNRGLPDDVIKTVDLFTAPARGASTVQLDRSASGA